MSVKVLQVNFKISIPSIDYKNGIKSVANNIAAVPGLRWKIWTINDQEHEAGGIYLFNDDSSLKQYIEGPITAEAKNNPAFSEILVKQFDVIAESTSVTRGPV